MIVARFVSLLLAIATTALAAGFFYAWDVAVIPGLTGATPDVAIAAMQAVNATIRNFSFALCFFGSAVFALLSAILLWRSGPPGRFAAAAFVVYACGVLAVTFLVHVPLNEDLAQVTVAPAEAQAVWENFAASWQPWNFLRTVTALLACLCLVLALASYWAQRRRGP